MYPIREHFDAAERVRVLWALSKLAQTATCELWTHWSGFELRLLSGAELLRSEVCRSQEQLVRLEQEWRAAMIEKGWA